MSTPGRASAVAWGIGAVLAGGLMAQGGVREVQAYAPVGAWLHVAIGGAGAVASILFAAGGLGLATRRGFARRLVAAGGLGMIPVHLLGAVVGYIGIPGDILGIVFPLALLAALAGRPGLGATGGTAIAPTAGGPHAGTSRSRETDHRFAAAAGRGGGRLPAPRLL